MSRGFVSLQLLVDRYIIGWPSDVQLTEESPGSEALGVGWSEGFLGSSYSFQWFNAS